MILQRRCTFHISLIVEVGHLPTVLLIIVVVRVGGVVGRSYRLCVRRSSVVEVHLRPCVVLRLCDKLLRLFPLFRPVTIKIVLKLLCFHFREVDLIQMIHTNCLFVHYLSKKMCNVDQWLKPNLHKV